jgi:hypothetical protein
MGSAVRSLKPCSERAAFRCHGLAAIAWAQQTKRRTCAQLQREDDSEAEQPQRTRHTSRRPKGYVTDGIQRRRGTSAVLQVSRKQSTAATECAGASVQQTEFVRRWTTGMYHFNWAAKTDRRGTRSADRSTVLPRAEFPRWPPVSSCSCGLLPTAHWQRSPENGHAMHDKVATQIRLLSIAGQGARPPTSCAQQRSAAVSATHLCIAQNHAPEKPDAAPQTSELALIIRHGCGAACATA